jgi:hypothetical protein
MHLNNFFLEDDLVRSKGPAAPFLKPARTTGTQIGSLKPNGHQLVQESRPDLESRSCFHGRLNFYDLSDELNARYAQLSCGEALEHRAVRCPVHRFRGACSIDGMSD